MYAPTTVNIATLFSKLYNHLKWYNTLGGKHNVSKKKIWDCDDDGEKHTYVHK